MQKRQKNQSQRQIKENEDKEKEIKKLIANRLYEQSYAINKFVKSKKDKKKFLI